MIAGNSIDQEAQPGSCSILLVEDNKINQKVVVLMLSKFGITPEVADSGTQAVELTGEKAFDLILMDLHMPGMDGLEATRIIRERLGANCPPVVALTADVFTAEEDKSGLNGLDGYLMKPINSSQLRECIESHTAFKV